MWAFSEVTFAASASNIAQVNWTRTSTKLSIGKGHCICFMIEMYLKLNYRIVVDVALALTLS